MSKFSNSSLVDFTLLSNNCTKPRNKAISKITIHHMAGNLSVETCGRVFQGNRQASSNYGIGSDGRVGLYVEEKDRAWTSSSADNDNQAVTIEVANDVIGGNWHVSNEAYNKLIELCVDICVRNGMKELVWTGNKDGNLTVHNFFAATACPGPYLMSKMPDIASKVTDKLNKLNNGITKVETITNEEEIWHYLLKHGGYTKEGVAGLMGNLYAESGLKPNNLQNNGNRILGLTDEEFSDKVNNNEYTREQFINDKYGYGLAQWTFWSRKQSFYDYMIIRGRIDDLKNQLDYLINEIRGYGLVQEVLKSTSSVREASNAVLLNYERPADQSEAVQNKRYEYSLSFYNRYSNKTIEDTKPIVDVKKLYRVRLSWNNAESQLGAYEVLDNAKKVVSENLGYAVYDWNGVEIYRSTYLVRVTTDVLNIRSGPGTSYGIAGQIKDRGVYTIISEENGFGKLKSGAGWISLSYTNKL